MSHPELLLAVRRHHPPSRCRVQGSAWAQLPIQRVPDSDVACALGVHDLAVEGAQEHVHGQEGSACDDVSNHPPAVAPSTGVDRLAEQ